MNKFEQNIMNVIHNVLKDDDVFWNNEIKANVFSSFALMVLCGVFALSLVLSEIDIFVVPKVLMRVICLSDIAIMFIAACITRYYKGARRWLKYMLLAVSVIAAVSFASVLNIFGGYFLLIPLIMSVRYYSKDFTTIMVLVSVFALLTAELIFGHHGIYNLNLIAFKENTVFTITGDIREAITADMINMPRYISNLLRGSFAPRLLLFSVMAIISIELANRAHEMVLEQESVTAKANAVQNELNMATGIQNAVLPKIFPAFPEHPELDIRASMDPAKEVGGDFYDFYLIDDTHLCLVIADVSGKGVPAALFMMIAKILIKTQMHNTASPKATAEKVNNLLCDGNEAEMFVTAWIGVLDLTTGVLTAVNAGHEKPAICRKNGHYELFKDPHGFVLAGMEGMRYKEYTVQLDYGDKLFLYTDGVPEATNAQKELFGEERMVEALNQNPEADPVDVLLNVRKAVDDFVLDAPQFDDLTMISFHYIGKN